MHPHTGYSSPDGFQMVPGVLNQRYSVPVQNAFGPLSEWVGLSMGVNGEPGYVENMACVQDSPNGAIGNFTNGTIGNQWYHW